jgi:uncharacterized protein (TIGR04141 family)
MPKSITISIRLLKKGKALAAAFREGHRMTNVPARNGTLYTEQAPPTPPTWLEFVEGLASNPIDTLYNRSCSAVFFVRVQPTSRVAERTMAITFGGAHHSLDPTSFERNFGLKVALNSIANSNLRTLDVATLDATTYQKRIQASRKSEIEGFGINIERDLLRLASGIPSDTSFAKTLAGKDALTIHALMEPSDIEKKCQKALVYYLSNSYKKDYPWVDYVAPVTDLALIKELDQAAFDELQQLINGSPSDIHLTLPDIVSPEETYEISYFGVGLNPGKKPVFSDFEITDYVEQIKNGKPGDLDSMATLKASHEVRVIVNGKGDRTKKQRLYDCFVIELEKKKSMYTLFGGEWYQIDKTFYDGVEKSFTALISKTPFRTSTTAKNERLFITELDSDPDLLNLDQVKISPTGAPGANLEPCDFFCRTKRFIHLKDGHSSSSISHLWNQGLVSAEAFIRDSKFRKDLREEAIKREKKSSKKNFELELPNGRVTPVPKDYKVVFGVMRSRNKRSKNITLPFFSKVSLRTVADRIALMGYDVEVHLVEKL